MSTRQTCVRRLQKELKALTAEPLPNIKASPCESNILEWHYVIFGPAGSQYEGGEYHGKVRKFQTLTTIDSDSKQVVFPSEYPNKPPKIYMITPNGRFETNKRLCLTMSDYHPETWNPMWSVGSILTGLLSFMLEESNSVGSIRSNLAERQKLAVLSHAFNRSNPIFRKTFPELAELTPSRTSKTSEEEEEVSSGAVIDSGLEKERDVLQGEAKKRIITKKKINNVTKIPAGAIATAGSAPQWQSTLMSLLSLSLAAAVFLSFYWAFMAE